MKLKLKEKCLSQEKINDQKKLFFWRKSKTKTQRTYENNAANWTERCLSQENYLNEYDSIRCEIWWTPEQYGNVGQNPIFLNSIIQMNF